MNFVDESLNFFIYNIYFIRKLFEATLETRQIANAQTHTDKYILVVEYILYL